ncbi:MAG: hypothetical protein NZL92_10510 [Gloeomargarita sp. SKYG116]|nr:hypothetical protein [Gloeomargarita sp. SKYG116]MCS7226541.1 hypothetical protein [Gloeomargarita sp. SKYB31]MDW8402113.1 hypothetical protein [Gloeomargarita sp. SKYGB_i_bin116]
MAQFANVGQRRLGRHYRYIDDSFILIPGEKAQTVVRWWANSRHHHRRGLP